MCTITAHDVERYQQRVESVDDLAARGVIAASSAMIDIAAGFGAHTVVLGNGARLALDGDIVVTVLAPRRSKRPRVRRAPRFEWVW